MKLTQVTHDVNTKLLREFQALVRQVSAGDRDEVLTAAKAILRQSLLTK